MKRLVGGDFLLDISSIELAKSVDGTTKTNITDVSIIEQLTSLQRYIANPNMAKPIWIKLYNGETDELVIARGTFANVDTGEFEICVQLDGYKLVIYIEFTQVLNGDDEPMEEWYIDTNDAKYLFTSDAQNVKATIEDENFGDVALTGDLSVGGDLVVTGGATLPTINGETTPSVKPIYCHPIFIDFTGKVGGDFEGRRYYFTCLIFNNDATPFTLSTFFSYISNLCINYDAKIMTTGMCYYDNISIINACIKRISNISDIGMYGLKVGTNQEDYIGLSVILEPTAGDIIFEDGVNKIN